MIAPVTPSESFASVQRSWGWPSGAAILALCDQGISITAMAEPWPLGTAKVHFFGDGTFDRDVEGECVWTFIATDYSGTAIDIVAYAPESRKIASWYGVAEILGDPDQVDNRATYAFDGTLRVHADPIAWLKSGRDGIVIVNRLRAAPLLRNATRMLCADPDLAGEIELLIQPPKPQVEIFVERKRG
jgi:hypothetical protein